MTKPGQFMDRTSIYKELAFALCLIIAIVASRLWIDLPNFKPVMALALLAGFLFTRNWLSVAALTSGMWISDVLIGFYDARVAIVVYLALICPMLGGVIMRRWNRQHGKLACSAIGFGGLAALNFYILTTFSVWLCFNWYPPTVSGLLTAFAMGLPFLKWTLAGNLVFSSLLFGGLIVVTMARSETSENSRRAITVAVSRSPR